MLVLMILHLEAKEEWPNNLVWLGELPKGKKLECQIQQCIYKFNFTFCLLDTFAWRSMIKVVALMNDKFDGLKRDVVQVQGLQGY